MLRYLVMAVHLHHSSLQLMMERKAFEVAEMQSFVAAASVAAAVVTFDIMLLAMTAKSYTGSCIVCKLVASMSALHTVAPTSDYLHRLGCRRFRKRRSGNYCSSHLVAAAAVAPGSQLSASFLMQRLMFVAVSAHWRSCLCLASESDWQYWQQAMEIVACLDFRISFDVARVWE